TRNRTYDFLLKGMIFCHECGYPLAVINRKTAAGEDRLFFVCRTYQRFTKAGICSCHCIKEQTVTNAVIEKVREICQSYLQPDKLQSIALAAMEQENRENDHESEIQNVQNKIYNLTINLDKMYMDRLNGLLAEADFERMYQRLKMERTTLEEKLKEMEMIQQNPIKSDILAKELVQRYLNSAYTSRELLVSLIERIELTEQKQIIIKFRFPELEAFS
ncbi:MAG: zinc ribbon domain-containing protein, partial [Anaerotignum sp.]